jgi:hypothetical protein
MKKVEHQNAEIFYLKERTKFLGNEIDRLRREMPSSWAADIYYSDYVKLVERVKQLEALVESMRFAKCEDCKGTGKIPNFEVLSGN